MAGTKLAFWLFLAAILAVIAWYMRNRFDPESMRGKKVVICGASTGIGEELAYQYAGFGAEVLLVARREEELKKVVSRSQELGAQKAIYVVADLSSLENVKNLLPEAQKLLGGVDILVLNHYLPFWGLWNENSDLHKVPKYFAVNTISYINIATVFLSELQKSNGSIVVVSSIAGVIPFHRSSVYNGNKYALHGFFNSLRQDLALQGHKGVDVTLCVLGYIATKNAVKRSQGTHVGKSITPAPVDECAAAIIKGAASRERQIYFPSYLPFVETLHFFIPNFVESATQVLLHEKPLKEIFLW